MYKAKLIFSLILLSVSCAVVAQNVKPGFKQFLLVTYRPNDPVNPGKMKIEKSLEINGKGHAELKLNYTEGIADTTYQLSETLITRLNKIFNGKQELKSYMIKDRFPEGTTFRGALLYLSYTDDKDVIHNFIVVPPFMSQEFNDLLDQVTLTPENVIYTKNITIPFKSLGSRIITCEKNSKYLNSVISPNISIKLNPHNR
jgi:hypothetical protein